MSNFLSKVLPAVISAVGALLVALLGFYQWRKQQKHSRLSDFDTARRKAYENLWSKLEEVNLRLRDQSADNRTLHTQLKDANTFFLQNSLYLEESEQGFINDYISALHHLRSLIYTSSNENVVSVWEQTGVMTPEFDEKINLAVKDVDSIRQKLKSRIRDMVTR